MQPAPPASPGKDQVECAEEEAAQPGQDLIWEGTQKGGPQATQGIKDKKHLGHQYLCP